MNRLSFEFCLLSVILFGFFALGFAIGRIKPLPAEIRSERPFPVPVNYNHPSYTQP